MKEAAGEANMTVITIVLIAVVLGIGSIIVNNLMGNTKKSSCCSSNGGVWTGGYCCKPKDDGSTPSCTTNEVPVDTCTND